MAFRKLSLLTFGIASWHASGEGEVVFGGHYNACRGISFKPDGSQVVLASEDNPANLRPDPPTVHSKDGTRMFALGGANGQHMGPVWDAVFDNVDGSMIATASADSTIMIWKMGPDKTGEYGGNAWVMAHQLAGHAPGYHVMALDWHPTSKNRFASCGSDTQLIVWDYNTNALSATFNTWIPSSLGLAPLPSSSPAGAAFAPFDAIPAVLTDVKFAPNGQWIGFCGFHWFCNVLSPSNLPGQTWTVNWLFGAKGSTHTAAVWGFAFSDNNQYAISGGYDRFANVWEDLNFNGAMGAPGPVFVIKASLSTVILDESWSRTCPIGVTAGCDIPEVEANPLEVPETYCAFPASSCRAPHYIGGPVWSVGFYGTLPITGDADHQVRIWEWEETHDPHATLDLGMAGFNADPAMAMAHAHYVPKWSFKGCLSPPFDITVHTKTNPPMIGVACGSDSTGRSWQMPEQSAFTTTTTTLPWVMFTGAGERAAPSLIALFTLLVSAIAQRGA